MQPNEANMARASADRGACQPRLEAIIQKRVGSIIPSAGDLGSDHRSVGVDVGGVEA
jgi:hypothetical protein